MQGLFIYILQIYFRNLKHVINTFSFILYVAHKESHARGLHRFKLLFHDIYAALQV